MGLDLGQEDHGDHGIPWPSILSISEVVYPYVLLLALGIIFCVHTAVLTPTIEEEAPKVSGPGGRPLPRTKKGSRPRRDSVRQRAPVVTGDVFSQLSRRLFQAGTGVVFLTFLASTVVEGVNFLHSARGPYTGKETELYTEARVVFIHGGSAFWFYIFLTLLDWKDSPSLIHLVLWAVGFVLEGFSLLCWALAFRHPRDYGHRVSEHGNDWDLGDLVLCITRLCILGSLTGVYLGLTTQALDLSRLWRQQERPHSVHWDTERTPLLNGRNRAGSSARPNGENGDAKGANGTAKDDFTAFYRPNKLPHRTWWEYLRGYSIFFPYLWPSKQYRLQIVVLGCFTLVLLQRVVNILVPMQLGAVVEALSKVQESGTWDVPVGPLLVFAGLKVIQGQSGLLGCLRSLFWIPVSQYSYRALTVAAFEHVHTLSLDFHVQKRTGELLSALNKGASVNSFLEATTFQVTPLLFDLLLTIAVLWGKFGALYALYATIITFTYLVLTIRMASTRADQRRDMVNADREEEAIKSDSITAYETVKYFNAEKYELDRYCKAVDKFQGAEAKVTTGLSKMNIVQALVFMVGMLVVTIVAAYEVASGRRTVGDFVVVMTYLNQLQGPLNFFGSFYRTVQQALISGERLLEVFKIQPTVVDRPGVKKLKECKGHVQWTNVDFRYKKHEVALKNLSFECKPGTTTAFVGESGGGKSTIFRLMFRYYNTREGSIKIDGHNVESVSIDSVRRFIGVVPQDPILFNETIMYNLKYANTGVTDEEVYAACKAASIHDNIMKFDDGYNTRVGERGLRLSGGEKQRVAIARAILKKPKIVLLDEATSALDSETEEKVQGGFLGISGEDKTLLIIAHRLSTIVHADQIIVLQEGRAVEKGTHAELLARKGAYHSMWTKQLKAETAIRIAAMASQQAKSLSDKASMNQQGQQRDKEGHGHEHGESSDSDDSTASSSSPLPGPITPAAIEDAGAGKQLGADPGPPK